MCVINIMITFGLDEFSIFHNIRIRSKYLFKLSNIRMYVGQFSLKVAWFVIVKEVWDIYVCILVCPLVVSLVDVTLNLKKCQNDILNLWIFGYFCTLINRNPLSIMSLIFSEIIISKVPKVQRIVLTTWHFFSFN